MEKLSLNENTGFWGDYSDLYHTLSAVETQSLENAILARRIGRFEEAQRIFDADLPSPHILPVLALEKASLFSRLGLEQSRFSVLDEALNSRSQWRTIHSERVEELLGIIRSESRLLAFGGLRRALKEARDFREGWTDYAIEAWTDLEFGCAFAYYSIIKWCSLWSNWTDPKTDLHFLPTPTVNACVCLDKILEATIERRKWQLSLSFIQIQVEFVEAKAKLSLGLELLRRCEAQAHKDDKDIHLAIFNYHIFLAETMLYDMDMVYEAKGPIENASKQLEKMIWIRASDQQKRVLERLLIDDYPVQNQDPIPKLIELGAAARDSGDRPLETRILSRILSRLNQVENFRRDSAWYTTNNTASSRFTELYSDTSGRVILVASSIARVANTLGSTDNQAELVDYIQRFINFEATYPEFDIPITKRDLYRGAAIALRKLGHKEEADDFDTKKLQAILNSRSDPSQFYRKYRDKPFDEWAPHLLELIISWIRAELIARNLSAMQAAELLLISTDNRQTAEEVTEIDLGVSQPPSVHVERLYGSTVPVDCDLWGERLLRFEKWLWHSPPSIAQFIRHTVLGDLQRARCATVQTYALTVANATVNGVLNEDMQLDVLLMKKRENDRLLDIRKRLDPNAMGASEESILSQMWICAVDRSLMSTSFKAFKTGLLTDQHLLEAQNFFEAVYERSNPNNPTHRLVTISQIALCKALRYKLFGTVAADEPLDNYEEYDRVYMQQRMAKSVLRGADNLVARAELVSRWSFTNHYNFAIGHIIEALGVGQIRNSYHRFIHQNMKFLPPHTPSPKRDVATLFTQLIDWTQKKKARSVTEALGAEVILSQAVLANASSDEHAKNLLQREAEVQLKIDKNEENAMRFSNEMNAIRSEMRNCSSLNDIMSLRDGQALDKAQIKTLVQGLGDNVLLVDYVCVPTAFTALPYQIIPMVYKNGDLVQARIVTQDIHLDSLSSWINTYLDDEQKEPVWDKSALSGLYPLIETAIKFSNPGEPIVISPTEILFRIPLHAIQLPDGQYWIQRNPIIYIQSLSILRLCHASAASHDPSYNPKVLAVQALSDEDLALPEAADMAFASRVKARLLQREALTKKSFLQASTGAELVHFYGHVSYDQPRFLDQYLAIRDLASERVTVRDLFELHLRPGTHINLIGCQSGRSQVRINDDLLGLSTAMIFAGATSIVATMWSIQMGDAAAFQEALFDEMIIQSGVKEEQEEVANDGSGGDGTQKYLDLAVAAQKAILRIMMDEAGEVKPAYHWAGFFLQGCWNKFPIMKGLVK